MTRMWRDARQKNYFARRDRLARRSCTSGNRSTPVQPLRIASQRSAAIISIRQPMVETVAQRGVVRLRFVLRARPIAALQQALATEFVAPQGRQYGAKFFPRV